MKPLYCFIVLLFLSLSLDAQENSQPDSVAVAQVIQNMFAAMKTSDTNLLKTCFSPTSILQTIANKNGVIEIKNQSLQDFINDKPIDYFLKPNSRKRSAKNSPAVMFS